MSEDNGGGPSPLSEEEIRQLAEAFLEFSAAARDLVREDSTIASQAGEHIGIDPADFATGIEELDVVEHPNLQLALNALSGAGKATAVIGLSPEINHFQGFSMASLLTGAFRGPSAAVAPTYRALPIDVDETLQCVSAGLWLLVVGGRPVIVGMLRSDRSMPPTLRVEVFAQTAEIVDDAFAELGRLRHEYNVYRQKVLSFTFGEHGEFGVKFIPRPLTTADQVVLPAGDLASIERHTVGVAKHADALRARGQHLTRGLLLYGPPGTGKTHTVSYLMAAMPERTVLVLQGPGVQFLGQAAAIARSLPPAMILIEDVDLVANERGRYPGGSPFLFQLLNEIDGVVPSEDVLFVMTTNHLELLEPALAARPGRVDHAVEIGRPGDAARAQLLRLYLGDSADGIESIDPVVERTEGVTASFFKELVRRATFLAIESGEDHPVSDEHLLTALDELLTQAAPVLKAVLGADQPHGLPPGTAPGMPPGMPGMSGMSGMPGFP